MKREEGQAKSGKHGFELNVYLNVQCIDILIEYRLIIYLGQRPVSTIPGCRPGHDKN